MRERKVLTTTVLKKVCETPDTVTLRLGLEGPFEFSPGQAISIDPAQFEALDVEPGHPRYYSLASSPLETKFVEITIKNEGGDPPPLFSTYAVDRMAVGDRVTIEGVVGKYTLPDPLPEEVEGVVYIAAGSGVAPNRGILKHCLAAELPLRHLFFTQNRTAADVIYASELQGIEALSEGRVRFVSVLSREEHKGMEHGYITRELLQRELESFVAPERCLAFVCGPHKPRPGHKLSFVGSFTARDGILTACGLRGDRIIRESW